MDEMVTEANSLVQSNSGRLGGDVHWKPDGWELKEMTTGKESTWKISPRKSKC